MRIASLVALTGALALSCVMLVAADKKGSPARPLASEEARECSCDDTKAPAGKGGATAASSLFPCACPQYPYLDDGDGVYSYVCNYYDPTCTDLIDQVSMDLLASEESNCPYQCGDGSCQSVNYKKARTPDERAGLTACFRGPVNRTITKKDPGYEPLFYSDIISSTNGNSFSFVRFQQSDKGPWINAKVYTLRLQPSKFQNASAANNYNHPGYTPSAGVKRLIGTHTVSMGFEVTGFNGSTFISIPFKDSNQQYVTGLGNGLYSVKLFGQDVRISTTQ